MDDDYQKSPKNTFHPFPHNNPYPSQMTPLSFKLKPQTLKKNQNWNISTTLLSSPFGLWNNSRMIHKKQSILHTWLDIRWFEEIDEDTIGNLLLEKCFE